MKILSERLNDEHGSTLIMFFFFWFSHTQRSEGIATDHFTFNSKTNKNISIHISRFLKYFWIRVNNLYFMS